MDEFLHPAIFLNDNFTQQFHSLLLSLFMKSRTLFLLFFVLSLCLCASVVRVSAQMPRITTLFPIGGKADSSVEVEIRGANLNGADALLVSGAGVTGRVLPSDAKPDETHKPLWQAKCAGCHELRSPANRSMTPAQWAATVERMVKVRQAPISQDEADKITQFLTSAARAGRVTAQIQVAANTPPSICEIRVATAKGVSTAGYFEVGNLPEYLAANGKREDAQPVILPCIANGTIVANTERHFFKFAAKQGQKLIFDLKSFRYNELVQTYFNPVLFLYDALGKQIAGNHGYSDLDPRIEWNCPTDGEYTLEARDLLGRGNPGSVYRLTMGILPPDTSPPAPIGQNGNPQSAPMFCYARDANITLRAGMTTPVEIHVAKRDGNGTIHVEAQELPPGVTAEPLIIPQERGVGFLLLKAADGVKPLEKPFRMWATFKTDKGETRTLVVPQEEYRLNNQPRYTNRAEAVAVVRGQSEFNVKVSNGNAVRVHPRDAVDVKLAVTRREGFKSGITFVVRNLPSGWTANAEGLGGDGSELVLKIRPDGNNTKPFMERDKKLPPIPAYIEAIVDEFRFIVATLEIRPAVVNPKDADDDD
jgi:hypothetical protein